MLEKGIVPRDMERPLLVVPFMFTVLLTFSLLLAVRAGSGLETETWHHCHSQA